MPSLPAPSGTGTVQSQDVINTLRGAYPEGQTMPQDVKDYIERLEKENAKTVTKSLHSTTTAMGKAQKTLADTLEAKKKHKERWAAHIGEAIKTWESQLHDYRKQQAVFQETVRKAKDDIVTYQNTIQSLTAKVSQSSVAAMPPIPLAADAEEVDIDNEEEKLHGQLQTVLKTCAESLGINVNQVAQASGPPQQEAIELDAGEEADKSLKRPRSMEPFGGSSVAGDQKM